MYCLNKAKFSSPEIADSTAKTLSIHLPDANTPDNTRLCNFTRLQTKHLSLSHCILLPLPYIYTTGWCAPNPTPPHPFQSNKT